MPDVNVQPLQPVSDSGAIALASGQIISALVAKDCLAQTDCISFLAELLDTFGAKLPSRDGFGNKVKTRDNS